MYTSRMKTVVFYLLLLCICSPSFAAVQESGKSDGEAAPSCGPSETKLKVGTSKSRGSVDPPPTGHALLVVIQVPEQNVIPNCGIINRLAVDGTWVGANCNKSYFQIPLTSGSHLVCNERQTKLIFQGRAAAVKRIDVESGKVYCLKALGNVRSANLAALSFELLYPEEGKLLLSSMDLAHLKN